MKLFTVLLGGRLDVAEEADRGIKMRRRWSASLSQDSGVGPNGMLIRGKAAGERVELRVNGQLLSVVSVSDGRFKQTIKKMEKALAPSVQFSVVDCDGTVPHESGCPAWAPSAEFQAEGGTETLDLVGLLQQGYLLDKKGYLRPSNIWGPEQKLRLLALYEHVSASLFRQKAYRIFVTHGTLLGLWRDGDLIPGDDDFDCFYLSRFTSAAEVARERVELMRELRQHYSIRVGVSGHIKISRQGAKIDLMPAWVAGKRLNISGYTSMPGGAWLVDEPCQIPFMHGTVNGVSDPEAFFRHQYGDNWATPDPAYRSAPCAAAKQNRKLLRPQLEEIREFGPKGLRYKAENGLLGWL